MKTASVAEVCEVNPRLRTNLRSDDQVAFVGMADLNAITATASDVETRPYSAVAKAYTSFEHGDVLVAKITPCFENCKIGQAVVSTPVAFGSTEFHVLRPISGVVDPRYLLHFLRRRSVLRLGEQRMTGAGGQRRVPARFFDELEIPLPSIEEQRRIASILDAVDALRSKRRQALEKLDALTQSIFIDMFGTPDSPSVPCACLGELVRAPITRGVDQPGPDVKGGVPYIRTTDVTRGVTHRSELSTCSIEIAAPFSRSIVEYGDIVICIRATVGPTLRVGEGLAGANLSRGTARIAPADSVRSEYLFAALSSEYFRRQVEGQLRGATFLQLPLGELRELSVPLPNLEQQDLFVDRWGAVERTRSRSVASLNHLDQLFMSLQHRAFRGEL